MSSTNSALPTQRPCERDYLEHVHQFRLTIPEAFARRFSLQISEAQTVLDQLMRENLLATAPFRDGSRYYHLTPQGARTLAVSADEAKPLKVCHHAIAYGTLYYATMLDVRRKRLTKHEFINNFPDIYRPGPQINYVLQPDGKLSFVRLDGDISVRVRPGAWERLISTVRKLYDQRRKIDAFNSLIEAGVFNVVILTAMLPKVTQIRRLAREISECHEQYQQQRWSLDGDARKPLPAPLFEIEHIPGLFQLMRPRPRSSAAQLRGQTFQTSFLKSS